MKSINPRKTQLGILKRLIELNLNTDFGEEYSFKNIRCYRDFCEKVPETDYEFLKKYISLISSGRNNVLTSDTVLLFEPSSGTTTDSKLIPYTTSLKNEFQRGIYPWIADMYFKNPGLLSGKSYWSISPVIKKESSESGITIGFEDDSEYFSPLMRFFLRRIFAVPDIVRNCSDLKVFKYTTLLFLLRTKNLCFISIWSPTFLLSLLKPVSEWYKALVHDIRFGTFSPPCNVEPSFKKGIKKYL
ncbi:GH3 auxin-responsive promoter family protein, partial [bacterium]|nr:GH3 auxin-responsive promoter family protein [bacterium]